MKRPRNLILSIMLGAGVLGLWAAQTELVVGAAHNADPGGHPLPVIDLERDDAKSMVVRLNMTGAGSATVLDAQVVFGRARSSAGEPPLLRMRVLDDHGVQTQQFQAWDPRWMESEGPTPGSMSMRVVPQAVGEFVFPFQPAIETLTVFNLHEATSVGSYDLGAAVQAFCEDHPSDPDCRTDLRVDQTALHDPAIAGTTQTFTIVVANDGPNPAHSARVVDTLPAGFAFAGGTPGCTETSPTVVTCDIGGIPAGDQEVVSIDAMIDPALVYDAGHPVVAPNTVEVENPAGVDLDPSDNTSTVSTTVVAVADLAVSSTSLLSPPTDVLIGDDVDVTLRALVTSSGPSSPMDADLDRQASAEPGTSITPSSTTEVVIGLEDGTTQTIDTTFTVRCEAPGSHTFTFEDTITPTRPDDTDPNATNDSKSASLTVDCVVPVKLDIKPSSINLKSGGVVPTAVLTTDAGEYGLPLAFDASSIQPLTVRFGREPMVWAGGGSFEAHGRGHIGNSPTDKDMVLHFPVQGSGLKKGDAAGCVKGKFTGPGGEQWTFFGCDAVAVK